MELIEETAIATSDLPVAALKAHLRLGAGFADEGLQDAQVEAYLRAAIATIEGRIGKVLLSRRFRLVLDRWRGCGPQALPVAPVSEVVSVTVGERVVDGVRLIRDTHRPKIAFAALPDLHGTEAEVVFDAGFGAWADVPADLAQAVMLLAAEYFENRHEAGSRVAGLPFAVVSLIERWRTIRVLAGGAA